MPSPLHRWTTAQSYPRPEYHHHHHHQHHHHHHHTDLAQLVSSLAGQHLRPEDLALAAYRTCLIKNIADSLIVDF